LRDIGAVRSDAASGAVSAAVAHPARMKRDMTQMLNFRGLIIRLAIIILGGSKVFEASDEAWHSISSNVILAKARIDVW